MAEERTRRPASQYYWGDWWKDKALHMCSQPARGLWHEMNTLMHDGEPYGHLTHNGKPMTVAQLASLCRISAPRCKQLWDELLSNGVPSVADNGALFSRRMVRDEALREARAAGGKEGAEHGVKGASHGAKGGRPSREKGGLETPLTGAANPPPSSSSASSPTGSTSVDDPPKPPRKRRGAAADAATVGIDQLVREGVDPQHATDWLAVRTKKNLLLTPTAWEAVKAEAATAGMSLDDAVKTAAVNGWGGFKCKWLAGLASAAPASSARPDPEQLRAINEEAALLATGRRRETIHA